jgi:hypothetical protein
MTEVLQRRKAAQVTTLIKKKENGRGSCTHPKDLMPTSLSPWSINKRLRHISRGTIRTNSERDRGKKSDELWHRSR